MEQRVGRGVYSHAVPPTLGSRMLITKKTHEKGLINKTATYLSRYGANHHPMDASPIPRALVTVRLRCGLLAPKGFRGTAHRPIQLRCQHRASTFPRLSGPQHAAYSPWS